MRLRYGFWFVLAMGWLNSLTPPAAAQSRCAERLNFTPVSQPNMIEWNKFPEFTLPFPVIYGGPRLNDRQGAPLRHGFSHIVHVQDGEFGTSVQLRQWALEYAGFATGLNQPWETIESPWNNDLNAYRAKWDRYLSDVSGGQKDANGRYRFPAGRFTLDIERISETDTRILRLKQDPAVPATYRQLPDAEFIARYKKDMRNLYAEGMRYVRERADLSNVVVSSYADTPILNTYLNVIGNTWADWTTNLNRVNYLVKDSTERQVGGPYYNQLDALSPSAYYFYDYPNPLARDYLPYLLFQVEANRAWSNKPVVPYVWLRYHNTTEFYPKLIQPFMAEATAIFPFFSGAKGLWLWDEPGVGSRFTANLNAYEQFIHGLYRLSRFADMFQGNYELVIETPARDLMDKQLPVWRGVVKDQKILIAAQNSYAVDGQKTAVTVRYKSWQQTIELTGREVYLCQFDIPTVTAVEPTLPPMQVSPNPAQTELSVSFPHPPTPATEMTLHTMTGQLVLKKSVSSVRETLSVATLPAGIYLLRIQNGTQSQTRRVVIAR
ncbi:T9SS C-terminal target domain-containing protein [Fibrisoma montanum]|uniref:T9SS C-terminal target domain-containing protein n=1 Tax=Fibrisoma montanum TaxID=2305895 RepID=A0A418MCF1_9BACT|nr:T9SS type A sorting domain-containing protein [Fibrisoma montanum]RIV24039.1 T9SS C-terminal target domain-containing protein [Fibrisoma montanum]